MKTMVVIMATMSTGIAHPGIPTDEAARNVPSGYEIIARVHVDTKTPTHDFEVVAARRKDEGDLLARSGTAPARPLLVFQRRGSSYVLVSRNDHIIMKADEGGQCDPFLDGGAGLTAKGRYVTIENGVSCGAHWTDYITFRVDKRTGGFIFDNERREKWRLNPDTDPNADALVLSGPPQVTAARPGAPVPLALWRRTDD